MAVDPGGGGERLLTQSPATDWSTSSEPATPTCWPRRCSTEPEASPAINPILIEGLMLHAGAERSTYLERQHGLAGGIFGDLPLKPGDTFIVASNSGGNAVCEELARLAGEARASVIAILSSRHAEHSATERDGSRLAELADVVIDNHGDIGDAGVDIDGIDRKVGPTSTGPAQQS